ncbi:transposase [Labilithrix luteola]|uniref:Transposase n=1 Tax=Labilithrix luteola TaxID=1391654 RepID=A0A0K1Q1C3_9BACT|nr:DUF3050 domain-containing protein [Labilithrix luteola]AKU99431.1 transposase [Labilithrix luteola]
MPTTARVTAARERLLSHPLFARRFGPDDTRVFMEHHVFAVWDFMSLLKRLQIEFTTVTLPWRRPAHRGFARLINEIVLGEESDDDGSGGHASHFEVYLEAMREAGADRGPILGFLEQLDGGVEPASALASSRAPEAAASFTRHTLSLALDRAAPPVAVAAAFFHGREAIIPDMFRELLVTLEREQASTTRLRYYLERHIEIDEGSHGPLASRLLDELCASSERLAAVAEGAALSAIEARIALWDGVLSALAT